MGSQQSYSQSQQTMRLNDAIKEAVRESVEIVENHGVQPTEVRIQTAAIGRLHDKLHEVDDFYTMAEAIPLINREVVRQL